MLIAIPIIWVHESKAPVGFWDALLCVLHCFFVALETIADQQQWEFQSEKKAILSQNKQLKGRFKYGFIHDGLWSYGRHPNYFSEQSIWFVFFLFR